MDNIIKSWNNRTIRIREDRYVSLTDMAQASGKQLGHWNELKSSKSYLEALSRTVGIPRESLIQINQSSGDNDVRGTWAHPKVAIRFAQWCSDDFALQVDFWVDELFLTNFNFVSKAKNSQGFVYLARAEQTNWYKIGESCHPSKRMTALQIGSPLELLLACQVFTFDRKALEKALHIYYQRYWIRSEWYELSDETVETFLLVANQLDGQLELKLMSP